uniref:Kazal-type serine protease inhibitor family protein n=1 Tax=Candidatus Electronema sp. TaxID=2698783 RepID=UPI004056C584
MKRFVLFSISGAAMLLLAGCPKFGPQPEPPPNGVCGGLLNVLCPADQYCQYGPDANCGIADMTGICQPKPEVCTKDYVPVCGCDDTTYGNACTAAAAGVSVKHQGECGSPKQ